MRTSNAPRVLVAAVYSVVVAAVLLAPAAGVAGAATDSSPVAVQRVLAAQSPEPTQPSDMRIDPSESEQANQDRAQRKAVIAVVAIVLLAIVFWGRKARNKRKPGGGS